MTIEDRNLAVGTKLWANYKKARYVCTVEASADGDRNEFVLEGGKRFRSPSSAAMEVMGGKAVNGWRFWSLEGTEAQAGSTSAEPKAAKAKSGRGKKKSIYKIPNQSNTPEGQTRWFCTACMKSFNAEGTEAPAACPEGHPMEDLNAEAPSE